MMKGANEILKNITMVTQFGLSLVIPLFMCLGLCWYLCDRFSIGSWIYIFGFILGLGSSFMTAYKLYLTEMNRQKKEKKPKVSFNRH